jgi:hypothetical protein
MHQPTGLERSVAFSAARSLKGRAAMAVAVIVLSTRHAPSAGKDDNAAVAHFYRNGAEMSEQPGGEVLSETAQAWDSVRRFREPLAWALLILTAIVVIVSACQLFNLAGARIPVGPGPATSAFALRAAAVAPQFVDFGVIALPVLSVVLVTFSGGLTEHARRVVQTAVSVQAVSFVLAAVSLDGAAGSHARPGSWFVLYVAEFAIAATALTFTGAVLWSRALPSPVPQFLNSGDDDENSGDDDEDFDEGLDRGERD